MHNLATTGRIRIRRGALDAIAAHARREAPLECCGLLIARGERIDEAAPVRNHAADPSRRFEIHPADLLAAIKRARGTPDTVAGAYHSHPRSPADPSEADVAEAFSDFLYLIAGPVEGPEPLQIRAYLFVDGNFRCIPLVPDA